MTNGILSANAKTNFASGTHKGRSRRSTASIRGSVNLCAAVPFTTSHPMASSKTDSKSEPKTKKFGKGERTVPHSSQKAKKFYPAEDEAKPRKVSRFSDISRSHHCRDVEFINLLVVWSNPYLTYYHSGPQIHPPCSSAPVTPTGQHPHPPRWSLPRQARRSSQTPTSRRSPRHWSFLDQWRPIKAGQRQICHSNQGQGRLEGHRRQSR